jgi:hypothetical protein
MRAILFIGIIMLFTISACEKDVASGDYSDTGTGGSTARFAAVGDYLYTVNDRTMQVFRIEDPQTPVYTNDITIGEGTETIFPYKDNLFLGTRTGMHVLSLEQPANPQKISFYEHIVSCDPVVVQDTLAFVTLRSTESWCNRGTNELHIIDISNPASPVFLKKYNMQSPGGLGIYGNNLYVCDVDLKHFDVSDIYDIQLKHTFSVPANDVIPLGDILLVTADDGIYQYRTVGDELTFLSKISVGENGEIYN